MYEMSAIRFLPVGAGRNRIADDDQRQLNDGSSAVDGPKSRFLALLTAFVIRYVLPKRPTTI